jgi:hypothetical protein
MSFHPFPRLPLELRQQIWELSVAPREVVLACRSGRPFGHGRQGSPPPPLLLASAESRSYCQQFYTKGYLDVDSDKYVWVNFDLDDVYMIDCHFMSFSGMPLLQRLTLVVTCDGEDFHHRVQYTLHKATALKTLTLIDLDGAPPEVWYSCWANFMQERYYRCDPAPYYTTILCMDLVLTPDNMLRFDRELRKWEMLPELYERPDEYGSDDALSDDDADPRDSRRRNWKHTEDCTCPQKN